MAMAVTEVKEWIDSLPEGSFIGVDDDGLSLRVVGNTENYCEVGGIPDDVPMSEEEALEIVLDLAEQNVIHECDHPVEHVLQKRAIAVIRDKLSEL